MTASLFRIVNLAACALLVVLVTGCERGEPQAAGQHGHDEAHGHDDGHEHPELAEPMSQMQYYAQKLGYSIEAENAELADFYLHEMEELAEEVQEDVPEYEGFQIADLTKAMLVPMLEAQERALDGGDWQETGESYVRLIESCNACHTATEHAFIRITPAEGESPFNQQFEP